MPGSASSCTLVAELMSSRSALAAVAVAALADDLAAWATAIPLIRLSAKSAPRILVMNFLVMVVISLFLLSFFVAGSLGFGFGHELSSFGLAVPAATLVVDATVGVDPDLAAGRSGGSFGGGGSTGWRGTGIGSFRFLATRLGGRVGWRSRVGSRLRGGFVSCCCLLALSRLLRGSRGRRVAGSRLIRGSSRLIRRRLRLMCGSSRLIRSSGGLVRGGSLFVGSGLFLLGFLRGLLSGGGVRAGVA